MREILFRGKTVESGEWHFGMFCAEGYDADFPCIIPNDSDRMRIASGDWHVDLETVGQFTGLYDRNGTKIFEGDIVKLDDRLCQVTWLDGNAQFDLRFIRDFGDIRIINFKGCEMRELYRYEVIGNIYDNPELLKGGAE